MHFDAKTKVPRPFPGSWTALALAGAILASLVDSAGSTNSIQEFPAPTQAQAFTWYLATRSNYLTTVGNTTSAWKFAQACFEWAEFATNDTQRASLADEGIASAKFAAEMDPKNPAAHFYLAMNKGQLARTKSLGALALVKEMEESFLRSIKLDPTFDHASAHRSLGMLYLDAPGWPASIGNKTKARKQLEKAVEIAPDYPTNHLTLMGAYLRWGEKSALIAAMNRYRRILPKAKDKYVGDLWQNSWRIWDSEWRTVVEKSLQL
jgi:tetratricopeptide (TPR) repeat protein